MSKASRTGWRTEVRSGFRKAGIIVVMIGWGATVGVGSALIIEEPRSLVLGSSLLLTASTIAILTMDRWIRVLPGILAYGAMHACIVLLGGALKPGAAELSKAQAMTAMAALSCGALLSYRLRSKNLRVADRVAVFGALASLMATAFVPTEYGIICLFLVCVCLAAPWPRMHWLRIQ